MLIRLARWVRMAGHDVMNPGGGGDDWLIQTAIQEGRTLLTRDKTLASRCMKAGGHCLLIRSTDLDVQLSEMALAGVELGVRPERCTVCNGDLTTASKDADEEKWLCRGCGKVYWMGSHWKGIRDRLGRFSG